MSEESVLEQAENWNITYRTSQQVDQIFTALAAAQKVMRGAIKDSVNPHLKSKYADLASCWDACREPLADNGLAILQPVSTSGSKATVTTILGHKSGQYIAADLELTAVQNTPQGIGSAITYARRYGLQGMVGIAPEEDDGTAASGGGSKEAAQSVAQQKITQLKTQQVGDDDLPTNLGGSYQPPPPAVDRVAQARDRAKVPTKPPTFEEIMAVFAHLKAEFVSCNAEHDYYEILDSKGFKHANEAVKAGVAMARVIKENMQLRIQLLKSTQPSKGAA